MKEGTVNGPGQVQPLEVAALLTDEPEDSFEVHVVIVTPEEFSKD